MFHSPLGLRQPLFRGPAVPVFRFNEAISNRPPLIVKKPNSVQRFLLKVGGGEKKEKKGRVGGEGKKNPVFCGAYFYVSSPSLWFSARVIFCAIVVFYIMYIFENLFRKSSVLIWAIFVIGYYSDKIDKVFSKKIRV